MTRPHFTPFSQAHVAFVFDAYPDNIREKLMLLRQLILDTANQLGITDLEETLKWGELGTLTTLYRRVQLVCKRSWLDALCREWLLPSQKAQQRHVRLQINPQGVSVVLHLCVVALAKGAAIGFTPRLDAEHHRDAELVNIMRSVYIYLTTKGSTLRLAWHESRPSQYSLFFNCKTSLIATIREVDSDTFIFESNRAIVFDINKPVNLPVSELRHCISLALRYHRIKHLPLLGL